MKINHTFKAIVLSFLILVTACKNETAPPNIAELEKLTKENQELKNKLENKDNEVNAFIQSFNEIEGNLEVIKQRENVLKGTTSSVELQKTKQEQIADDINEIPWDVSEACKALVVKGLAKRDIQKKGNYFLSEIKSRRIDIII